MIHISNLSDRHLLLHDPELFREVTSYLLYCRYEAEDDDHAEHREYRNIVNIGISGRS